MPAVPSTLPVNFQTGCLIGIASNRKLVPRELVVAMSLQPPPVHFSTGMIMVNDRPVEQARELLAEAAVAAKAKFLWFVDDDTIPPPNTLRRLHYTLSNNPDVMAVGGVYVTKCDPPGPVIFRGSGLGPFWNWKVGDVFEVTGMGAGCMLINCEVFEKIPKPWFPWIEDKTVRAGMPNITVSEDISFCNAVRYAGYKIVAHGGIICDHYDDKTGETFTLPENSYPRQPLVERTPPMAAEEEAEIPATQTPKTKRGKRNGSISSSKS